MSSDAKFNLVFTEEQIQTRVAELAGEISESMGGGRLLCLVVLRGGFFFAADLVRHLQGFERIDIDFVRLASYAGSYSTGEVKLRGQLPPVAGANVLVIEDLLDTGLTLKYLSEALAASGARSVRYAILIDKPARREHQIKADYIAFTTDVDEYFFGYGLDYEGGKRHLRDVFTVQHG